MTNTLQGMYNQRTILSKAKIDSGEYVDAHIMGDVSDVAIQKDGTKKNITIRKIRTMSLLQINQSHYNNE